MNPKCPYCGFRIEHRWISRKFHAGDWDWQTYFKMECPHCNKLIEVEVEVTPEFILRKFVPLVKLNTG